MKCPGGGDTRIGFLIQKPMRPNDLDYQESDAQYTRRSVGAVLQAPNPEQEFHVFCARYWPDDYDTDIDDETCVFDEWDKQLAPSSALLNEYDEDEPWSEWAEQYVWQVGEETIIRRAAQHAEAAGDRDVVFVCYEPDSARPRCHTFTILSVLEGQRQTGLNDFLNHEQDVPSDEPADSNTETCPDGEEWCGGPEGDTLPCFNCFDPDQKYDVGR